MKNVEMSLEGNILTIKVDPSRQISPSASGRTIMIASTGDNMTNPGPGSAKVGLNVCRKK